MIPEPPHRSVNFLLMDLTRLLRRRFADRLADAGLGLTLGEVRALAHVRRFPGRRQTEIADYLAVEPMTLVGYLDRLEKAGLVERVPDPGDRRAKLVHPTEAAVPAIRTIDRIVGEVRGQAFAGFTQSEIDQTFALLEALQSNLSAQDAMLVAPEPETSR